VYRSVLAVIAPGPRPDPVLALALDEARASRARLTLLATVPPPCATVCFASVCREKLHADALEATARDLRAIAAELPRDIPVTTVLAPTGLRAAVRRELARGDHDVVLVGAAVPAWRARLTRRLLARGCPAPVLAAAAPARARRRRRLAARLAGAG
jgi:hypothetical protein